jgi:2-keto-4-pentenoate hydratase
MLLCVQQAYFLSIAIRHFPLKQPGMTTNLGRLFLQARLQNTPLSSVPSLLALSDGYLVQKEIISLSSKEEHSLGKFVGWKVGATNEAAQKMMGFGPFYGPLFESNFRSSLPSPAPSKISLKSIGNVFKAIEAEIAITISADLPRRSNGVKYSAQEVWERVESIAPAIEFASTRFAGDVPLTPAAIVADFAMNGCVYLHPSLRLKPSDFHHDLDSLSRYSASLSVNSAVVASALTSSVLGNPIHSLTWLANELNSKDQMLTAGQTVMTGAAIQYRQIQTGDRVTFAFSHPLHSPEVSFDFHIIDN